jgi:hypothetical protein
MGGKKTAYNVLVGRYERNIPLDGIMHGQHDNNVMS